MPEGPPCCGDLDQFKLQNSEKNRSAARKRESKKTINNQRRRTAHLHDGPHDVLPAEVKAGVRNREGVLPGVLDAEPVLARDADLGQVLHA